MLGEYLDQHIIFEPRCLDGPQYDILRTYRYRFEGLPNVASYRKSE